MKNLTTGSGWNNDVIGNQNPATNTGGFSISTINAGPYYAMVSLGNPGDYIAVNLGGTAFIGTPPAGASAWGAAATLNPSDLAAPLTLTPPVSLDISTLETFAGHQGVGYDVHGVNSDPLFVSIGSNFQIQSGSAAKNVGLTIAGVPVDYLGYSRPQGSAYCIGAYEYPL